MSRRDVLARHSQACSGHLPPFLHTYIVHHSRINPAGQAKGFSPFLNVQECLGTSMIHPYQSPYMSDTASAACATAILSRNKYLHAILTSTLLCLRMAVQSVWACKSKKREGKKARDLVQTEFSFAWVAVR